MKMLYEMLYEMDWRQFIPSLIATIIGIFGPFWIQKRIEKSRQKKDAIERVKQLKSELEKIMSVLNHEINEECRYIDPIKTPVWTGLLNTNESVLFLMLNDNKDKIDKNGNWYDSVYTIYEYIDEYNKWWNLYSSKRASGITSSALDGEMNTIKGIKAGLIGKKTIESIPSIPNIIDLLDNVIKCNSKKHQKQ